MHLIQVGTHCLADFHSINLLLRCRCWCELVANEQCPFFFAAQVSPPLLDAVATHLATPATTSTTPSSASQAAASTQSGREGDEDAPPAPLPLVESLACLSAAFAYFGTPKSPMTAEASAAGQQYAEAVGAVAAAQLPWQQRLAGVQAAAALAARAATLQSARGPGASAVVAHGYSSTGKQAGAAEAAAAMQVDSAGSLPPSCGQPQEDQSQLDAPARWAAAALPGVAACVADIAVQQVRWCAMMYTGCLMLCCA